MKNIVLLCFGILGVACQSVSTNGPVKDLYINKEITASIPVSDIFDVVRFVSLEATDSCLIASPRKIIIENDVIFVSDGTTIFQYSADGHYLSSLSRKGRGPEEYYDVLDFVVYKDCIYIIDRNMKILKFSTANKYISSSKLDFFPASLFPLNDKEIILTSAYQNEGDKFYIYDINTFQKLSSFCPINKAELSYRHIMNQKNFFIYRDELQFHEPMNNTIYNLGNGEISARYHLDLYGKNPPADFWNQTYPNVVEINTKAISENYCFGTPVYAESGKNIIFTYRDADKYLMCLYSKKDKKAHQFESIEFHKNVPPIRIGELCCGFSADDNLSFAIPGHLFFDESNQIYAQELSSTIKNNENPVICIVKME